MSKNFDFNNWQARFRKWQSSSRATTDETPANNVNNSNPQTKKTGQQAREWVEEVRVNGKNLVSTIERLLHETEVRRLRIRQGERVLIDIPVTWAALGAIVAPVLAAVGAIAAVVTDCTVEITRSSDRPAQPGFKQPQSKADKPSSPDDLSYR